jgi:hypothetical protein
MKSRTGTPSKLPRSVSQRLDAYAVAAAAGNGDVCDLHVGSGHHSHWPYLLGGLGMLGLGVPAEAKVVYTPTHHVINRASSGTLVTYPVDLNHDGITDVVFEQSGGIALNPMGGFSIFQAVAPGNAIEVGTRGHGWARAMTIGAHIGPAKQFRQSAYMAFAVRSGTETHQGGYWFSSEPRYLGVAFHINGKTHYGWVRLKNSSYRGATVTGYAYETIPSKSIKAGQKKSTDNTSVEEPNASITPPAPQSATLGALAMGAPGVSIWRRKAAVGVSVPA